MALPLRSVVFVAVAALVVNGCTCANTVDIGGTGTGGGNGGNGGSGNGVGGNGGSGNGVGGNGGSGNGVGGNGGSGNGVGGSGGGFYDDGGNFEPPDDAGKPYYDGGCGPIDAGNPQYPRRCAPATLSECDSITDQYLTARGVGAPLLNGFAGNGFDDDCDGLVDESCGCPGNGQTKDCYLVPATMANPATKQPVGWCLPNAKGSLDCAGGELTAWSGVCRGANAPAKYDSCSPGDFNCDGLVGNNAISGCSCGTDVTCPTTERELTPFPPPAAIPLIDGTQWVTAAKRAQTTGWIWTVLGGDCDNVLPFPTFALYKNANSAPAANRVGTRTPVKFNTQNGKYQATPGEPLIAIQAPNYGSGVAGGQIYTAFALSGDYTVQGEFDLAGVHHVCTQKVRVRAPGVRAELCWDSAGYNDIDLHFARLQGTSCALKGWDDVCSPNTTGAYQDCNWTGGSGCPSTAANPPGWGYGTSPNTACQGWGSKRGSSACTNPRLDRDNVDCDRAIADPNADTFCGPENINIDNPKDNDKFVIGVNHYGFNMVGGSRNTKPHVNLYCNGARVLSIGYNPATGQTQFPLLTRDGEDTNGDFWTAALIAAHVDGGQLVGCDVATIPSHNADPTRDGPSPDGGGNALCVDSTDNLTPAPNHYNYATHKFVDPGSKQGLMPGVQPTAPIDFCKH